MKQALTILLLLLSLSGFAQWDSVKYSGQSFDSIAMAGTTIWVKPVEWQYTGALTVGTWNEGEFVYYGYSEYQIVGSIVPNDSFDEVSWQGGYVALINGDLVPPITITEIYINGYTFVPYYDGDWYAVAEINPFPAVGETCTVKLKYE